MTNLLPALVTAYIPSPADGVWDLGPVPIRGYAVCIIVGIVAAIWIGEKRWAARGGRPGVIQDVALFAVPFGLVGARLYHVATDWELYFGEGRSPVTALYVWRGGLGIWGGVALGAVGAYLGARRHGVRFRALADVLAPGVLVAQAIGRWGNWFNQELYGRPTDLPWAVEIDQLHFSDAYRASADYSTWEDARLKAVEVGQTPLDYATFHPTFLYECLWNLAAVVLVLWLERRLRLGYGRVMAVYVMAYTAGRGWIEYLRIDDVQLENVLGLRFNVWTSIVLFVAAAIYFVRSQQRHPGREPSVYRAGAAPTPQAESSADGAAADGAADDSAKDASEGASAPDGSDDADEPDDGDEAVADDGVDEVSDPDEAGASTER